MADENPLIETWRQIIEGDEKSWVLFENGTCVILVDPADDLAARAVAILREFGPVRPGSPAADFGTVPLQKAPGWVVTGHHPDVLTYVALDEVPEKDENTTLAVGLIGRAHRDQDAQDLTVIHVEDRRR
jgi:hypothetical protein